MQYDKGDQDILMEKIISLGETGEINERQVQELMQRAIQNDQTVISRLNGSMLKDGSDNIEDTLPLKVDHISLNHVLQAAPMSPYHGTPKTSKSHLSFSDIAHRENIDDIWWDMTVTKEIHRLKQDNDNISLTRKHSIDSASTASTPLTMESKDEEEKKTSNNYLEDASIVIPEQQTNHNILYTKSKNHLLHFIEKWKPNCFKFRDGVLGIWKNNKDIMIAPYKTIKIHSYMTLGLTKTKTLKQFDKKTMFYTTIFELKNIKISSNCDLDKIIMSNPKRKRVLKFGALDSVTFDFWFKLFQSSISQKRHEMQTKLESGCLFLTSPLLPKTIFMSPRLLSGNKINVDTEENEYLIHFLNGITQPIKLGKHATAGDACIAIRDILKLNHDSLYSIFIKGNYSSPCPLHDDEILKPYLQKNVIFVFRQELFIPDSPADKEVHEAIVSEAAAHKLTLTDCVYKILQGYYRMDFETCIILASLMIRIDTGIYDPLAHQRGSFRHLFHKILPRYHYENKKLQFVEDEIIKSLSELGDITKIQAEKKYLRICMSLPSFGSAWFHGELLLQVFGSDATFPPTSRDGSYLSQEQTFSKSIVGINFNGIHILSEKYPSCLIDKDRVPQVYLFDDIVKWATLGDLEGFSFLHRNDKGLKCVLTVFTCDFRTMEHFIDAYIKYKLKIRDGDILPSSRRK